MWHHLASDLRTVLEMFCWRGERIRGVSRASVYWLRWTGECGCEQVVTRRQRVLEGTHIFADGFGGGEWIRETRRDGLPFNDIAKIRGETGVKEPGPVFYVVKWVENGVYVFKWWTKAFKRVTFCDTRTLCKIHVSGSTNTCWETGILVWLCISYDCFRVAAAQLTRLHGQTYCQALYRRILQTPILGPCPIWWEKINDILSIKLLSVILFPQIEWQSLENFEC